MPTIKYKSNPNEDTAYCDGHKVQLIAVPSGTLQLPIHPTSDAGYVIDGNGDKHRVLMAYFMSGTPDYKSNETCDTAYLTVSARKIKVRLASKERGNLTLSTKANVNKGYVVGGDGEKHRVTLVETPTGTLQLPNNETDDSAYVVDNNGKKTKVRLFLLLSGGSVEVVIKGTSPLSLPDAIADSLSYVKAFGGTEQNGTPTPDAPVDIVSNNGVLKARHQSGLPLGYTLVESIGFTGAQYINTGLAINNNTRVLFDVKRSTSSAQSNYPWLGGTRDYVNNTNINKKTLEFSNKDSTKLYLQYATSGEITLTVPDTTQRHTYDFNKNELYIDENLIYTATQETFMGNATFLIGTLYSQGSVSTGSMFYGDVYEFKLWQDGTNLSMNLIPAKRNSDNVLGMYDTVSGTFFTNAGTGDFTAGNPISDPVEIYTDGTVETINVHGKNLFDKAQQDTQYYYGNDGSNQELEREGSKLVHSAKIPCLPNTTYTLSGTRTAVTVTAYYKFTFWDKNGNFISYVNNDPVGLESYVRTATTPNNCYYIAFNSYDTDTNVMLEQGSTATTYEPYFDGGTATAEMLLKVGDYQDVQSIIDGVVTRKVGIKVLDGTEDWTRGTTSIYANGLFDDAIGYSADNPAIICSHFRGVEPSITISNMPDLSAKLGASAQPKRMYFIYDAITTAAQFQQFLADQYAAGTPVIVIYPLATPTTESVTGQTLQVTDGDNVLEITQASLDNLELEAEYQAAVSLTIQEVQDANLDPNVEVTIN